MVVEFSLNNNTAGPYYVGYSPVACTIRLTDGTPGQPPVQVTVSNNNPAVGGQVEFYATLTSQETDRLQLNLPSNGTPVRFFIGGKFRAASTRDRDAGIKIERNGTVLKAVPMMVRVRKNANTITDGERDRFLQALLRVLEAGQYQRILDMHNESASSEIHGRASFLPWHRMYLLDLERRLQTFDASVTIPYWDFQQPAPRVFRREFMGIPATDGTNVLQFSGSNPLNRWRIPNLPRLARAPLFNTQNDRALVEDFNTTMRRGPGFQQFMAMERGPHDNAHTSFRRPSPISIAPVAPRDPLFFLLHCNVDRLWATWQALAQNNIRFNLANASAYHLTGTGPRRFQLPRIGDHLGDTMWPWNSDIQQPRPPTAPAGTMIGSPFTAVPGPRPKVEDTIDYQGRLQSRSLYFDYDTIPFIN